MKRLGLLAGAPARAFAKKAGLTPQRLDLLQIARTALFSQRQLAERLCVTHTVVTRLLQALERMGLVVRERDPEDRRIKLTFVTHDGLAVLARCFADEHARGAQATGEAIWLAHWRYKIARNGLRVDSILRAKRPRDFYTLARWSRVYQPSPEDLPKPPPPAIDPAFKKSICDLGADFDEFLKGRWVIVRPPVARGNDAP